MREHIEQINHLAEVLYNDSKNHDTVNKVQAKLLQEIVDEMQEQIDSIMNELQRSELDV